MFEVFQIIQVRKCHHEKTCQKYVDHICPKCSKNCASVYGLRRHLQWHDKPAKKTADRTSHKITTTTTTTEATPVVGHSTYRCRRCTDVFDNRRDLYLHGIRHHYNQSGGSLQRRPWGDDTAPWDRAGADEGLREVYEANMPLILEQHRTGPIQAVYNFPLDNDVSVNQLMEYAEEIYQREQRAFRLNLVFGVILQTDTERPVNTDIVYRILTTLFSSVCYMCLNVPT